MVVPVMPNQYRFVSLEKTSTTYEYYTQLCSTPRQYNLVRPVKHDLRIPTPRPLSTLVKMNSVYFYITCIYYQVYERSKVVTTAPNQ